MASNIPDDDADGFLELVKGRKPPNTDVAMRRGFFTTVSIPPGAAILVQGPPNTASLSLPGSEPFVIVEEGGDSEAFHQLLVALGLRPTEKASEPAPTEG